MFVSHPEMKTQPSQTPVPRPSVWAAIWNVFPQVHGLNTFFPAGGSVQRGCGAFWSWDWVCSNRSLGAGLWPLPQLLTQSLRSGLPGYWWLQPWSTLLPGTFHAKMDWNPLKLRAQSSLMCFLSGIMVSSANWLMHSQKSRKSWSPCPQQFLLEIFAFLPLPPSQVHDDEEMSFSQALSKWPGHSLFVPLSLCRAVGFCAFFCAWVGFWIFGKN